MKCAIKQLKRKISTHLIKLFQKTSTPKIITVEGMKFLIHPQVFLPYFFTSYFLAKNLRVKLGSEVLDLGTGIGIQAIFAAKNAKKVIATDINPTAVKCAKLNVKLNKLEEKIEVREGDLFDPVKGKKFDLIIFNPPYIPGKSRTILEKSWFCGEDNEVMLRFLHQVKSYLKPTGYVQFTYSTLGDIELIENAAYKQGLTLSIVARKNLIFEEIRIYVGSQNEKREI
ncbi:MAG: HemK2/MTQ2 family protein methyltransferase [Candidatus Odinarchaeia archaeon]